MRIRYGRYEPSSAGPTNGHGLCVMAVVLAAVLSLGLDLFDPVAKKNAEGSRLYQEGEYEEALKRFQEAQLEAPKSPQLHYNVGSALYKQQAFEEAEKELLQAGRSEHAGLGAGAFYNLGNALYKQGRFEQAVEAYKQSLRIDPNDVDAKINLEMAVRQLDRQEKQQQNQEKQQQNQQEQQQNQQEQQQSQQEQQQNGQSEEQDTSEKPDGEDADQQSDTMQQDQQDKPGQGEQARSREEAQPEEGLTREEAERILEALKNRELQAQKHRRIRLTGRRYTGKKW